MSTENPTLLLHPGRERPFLRRHPWLFSGAVAELRGHPELGDTVDLLASDGVFLARAAFSPQSQIRARVWTWDEGEAIDADFFRRRLQAALAARRSLAKSGETDALRLVHAESDRLPGLIVDRYGSTLVLQCLATGAERWRETLADLLLDLTDASAIYERSDADVRELEGLPSRAGWLRGEPSENPLHIHEHGLRFWVDLEKGHKTGFYLDQRSNRLRLREFASGRAVLDAFCYTGGFTLNALRGGAASVLALDSSADALSLARRNLELNGLPTERVEFLQADVFQHLRALRDRDRHFDLIVLDPPKLAPTRAQADRAARAYKDANLLAFKLLNPGGLLFTFSCSGGVDAVLFQKIVAGAALDAGVHAQMIAHLSQAADHPVALHFPEGAYLKGLICLVN